VTESALWLLRDARRAKKRGPEAIVERQRARFAEMVAFARARSPYYRELYAGLPEQIDDPTALPATSKQELMAHFDDWATDRAITADAARSFVADLALIGERFLGRYIVATTSGTTGRPGIFLLDDRTLAVTNALVARMMGAWLSLRDVYRIVAGGGRMAMVCATGGHYAEAVAAARLRKGSRRRARAIQVYPAQMPLAELVARLNEHQPAVLAPYAGIGAVLAGEQEAGRLRIAPALVVLSAEGLPASAYARISRAFGVRAHHSYAATECMFISYSCAEDWLHVNADWVLLEPVDAQGRPVTPGEQSHTTLISNLANRVQPILRYDIGDSVLVRPDPCPCGNRLPALRVQGRTADTLAFSTREGRRVAIPALMFEIVDTPGVELFQIEQDSPASLRLRLRLAPGVEPETVWQRARAEIQGALAEHELDHVRIERAEEPPEPSAGGKFRAVIPLANDADPPQGERSAR